VPDHPEHVNALGAVVYASSASAGD
jgi:hypothetical protein